MVLVSFSQVSRYKDDEMIGCHEMISPKSNTKRGLYRISALSWRSGRPGRPSLKSNIWAETHDLKTAVA